MLFNKSSGYISWTTADCGTEPRLSGPYKTKSSLITLCRLDKDNLTITVGTIKTAQWAVVAALSMASMLLLYLLAPCLRNKCIKSIRRRSTQISLSRTALVNQETAS